MQMAVGIHTSYWCALRSTTTNPHIRSSSAQLESRVPRNWPARFGAGERLQGLTYRYFEKGRDFVDLPFVKLACCLAAKLRFREFASGIILGAA